MGSHETVDGRTRTMYYEKGKPNPVRYANNCPGQKNWQKHHILPCSSVKESIAAAQASKPRLDEALKYFTTWNVNKSPNLMPLPTRKAYQNAYGKKGGRAGGQMPRLIVDEPTATTYSRLPCHQPTNWGHTDYNDKVEQALMDVWTSVTIIVNKHDPLDANDVSADLAAMENEWKRLLKTGRNPSQANWRLMMNGAPNVHNNFTMYDLDDSPV